MVEYYKITNANDNSDVKDVNLYQYYQDLSDGQDSALKVTGGADSVYTLLQFPVASSPLVGESKIKRYDLKFYVSDVQASSSQSGALGYDMYHLKKGTQITEGAVQPEVTDALVIGSNVSSKLTPACYMEDFESIKLDASAVYSDKANGIILGEPYLTLEDAKELAVEHTWGRNNAIEKKVENLYADGKKVYIKKRDDGRPVPRDNENFFRHDNVCFGYEWKDAQNYVRYDTSTAAPTAAADQDKKLVTYNNSNFDMISTSKDYLINGKEHMTSDVRINTSGGLSGACLELYNHWGAVEDEEGTLASDAQPAFDTGIKSNSSGPSASQECFVTKVLPMPVRLEANYLKTRESNLKGSSVHSALSRNPSAPMELTFDMKVGASGPQYQVVGKNWDSSDYTTLRGFALTFSNRKPTEGSSLGYYLFEHANAGSVSNSGATFMNGPFTLNNSFSGLFFMSGIVGGAMSVFDPDQMTNGIKTQQGVVFDTSANDVTFGGAHGLTAGDRIRFYTIGGSMPTHSSSTAFVDGTTYYVSATGLTSTEIKLALTDGGSVLTIDGAGSTVYAHPQARGPNYIEVCSNGSSGVADWGSSANGEKDLGYYGAFKGSAAGTFPIGEWVKIRFSFDVSGGIPENYNTYTNYGRADWTILSQDGETVYCQGLLPKMEFPADDIVWDGIEALHYPSSYAALQYDGSADDKTVLDNLWDTSVNSKNYGWTKYFSIWNMNRKTESSGSSSDAVDQGQLSMSGYTVPAKKAADSTQQLLIDNLAIFNAEHYKVNMSPNIKKLIRSPSKIVNTEPIVMNYRTGVDASIATGLASSYVNIGYKNTSDFTTSSGFWLWNQYGSSNNGNTTSIMDAAMCAGYSTRNEKLGDQYGILSTHNEDANERDGDDDSGYTSIGGTTDRATGILLNNASGYAENTTAAMTVDSNATTKFSVGDILGQSNGTIVGKITAVTSTSITIGDGTSVALVDNEELFNLRYNQNFYQRINIASNPTSTGSSTFTVAACGTTINDKTLTTSNNFNTSEVEVGQGISGQFIPDDTVVSKITSATSLEMSINATGTIASTTITFDPSEARLPRLITSNNAAESLSHAVKGFTQKGFTKLVDGGSGSLWGFNKTDTAGTPKVYHPGVWEKREHIGASTRIVDITEGNKLTVANPEMLALDDDEEYIIYLAYEDYHTIDLRTEKRDQNYVAPVKIYKQKDKFLIQSITLKGGKVVNNLSQHNTVFSTNASASAFIKKENIGRLFISPYRYWISIGLNPGAFQYHNTTRTSAPAAALYDSTNDTPIPLRSYLSIIPVDATTTVGTTFNESNFYYNSTTQLSPYHNAWEVDISIPAKDNIIELAKDYGLGAFDEEKGEGGQLQNSTFNSGINVVELPNLQRVESYKALDKVSLLMTPSTGMSDHIITIDSSNHTNKFRRPSLVTVYEDNVPEPPTLTMEIDKELPSTINFEWDSSGGDLWYGLLFIDTESIDNQYHKSIGHLPLNHNIEGSPTEYTTMNMQYYNVETADVAASAGRWKNDITGLAGYTKDFTNIEGNRDGGASDAILSDSDEDFFLLDLQASDNVYNITRLDAGTSDSSTTVTSVDSATQMTLASSTVFDSFESYTSPRFLQYPSTALLNTPTALTGTVYITNGATTLNGLLTQFTTELSVGQEIRIIDVIYTVDTITNDTACVLTEAYAGTTIASGAAVAVIVGGGKNKKFQTEFSVVAHIVPNKATATTDEFIIRKENSFDIKRLSTGTIRAEVKYGTNVSDFVRVESTTRVPSDGETPTCIILTIDTKVKFGNIKLYINGKLEDQSGKRLASPEQGKAWKGSPEGYAMWWDTTKSLFIASKDEYGRNGYTGKMEEVVFYERVIYPVAPQDQLFKFSKPISEVEPAGTSAGNYKVYSSKLFLKDYHNIRGTTIDEVASSNQISFKKSSFLIEG